MRPVRSLCAPRHSTLGHAGPSVMSRGVSLQQRIFHSATRPSTRHTEADPQARELSADLYRVLAVVVVVIGHWLLAAVSYRGGRFGYDEVLAVMPWTQWLTWFFQVVPVFFVVAGYANAASWTRWRDTNGGDHRHWLRHRVAGILGPTTAYVAILLVIAAVLVWVGVDGSRLTMPMWVVALHLWFVPVYLAVVSLTPVAVAAQRRWGLKAPAALAVAVAVVDAITLAGHVPGLGWVNYALCWGAIYQLGVAWFGGAFLGRRPILLATGAALVLATVIGLGLYPVSMIGVPGQSIQNTSPPTLALLALAAVQAGLLVAAAPTVTGWLRRARWRHLLATANKNVLALYLWHMVPVVAVALVGYPTGLLAQPDLGSGLWWLWRLVWVAILSAVTAAELLLLWLGRSFFARPTPTVEVGLPFLAAEPLLIAGTAMTAFALWRIAAHGFTPGGHFPVALAVSYAAGVVLVGVSPVGARDQSPGDMHLRGGDR
jgi:surface polysaccharide O-acyltransferase-like enzyme